MSKIKSYEQLNELFMRLKNGDTSVRNEIIESQMPLVYSIASKYYKVMDRDTAIQQGCLGLIHAVDHFDIDKGAKFSTYAVPNIHGSIKRFRRDRKESLQVKCSRDDYKKSLSIIKAEDQLYMELGRTPSDKEVAERAGITESYLGKLRNILSVYSMDAMIYGKDDSSTSFSETIKDDSSVTESMIIDKVILEDAMSVLDDREQLIIRLRYFEDKTQIEISKEVGISQVQVSRLESKILKKLKKAINEGIVVSTNKPKEDDKPMAKSNNLADLNNVLFDQLNKLSDPNLKGQDLKEEIDRAQAMSKVASQIINNGALVLKVKAMTKDTEDIPMLESKSKKRGRPSKDTPSNSGD